MMIISKLVLSTKQIENFKSPMESIYELEFPNMYQKLKLNF